jgi:hypothetical protein
MTQATLNGSVRKAPITNYPDLSEYAVDNFEDLPALTESGFSSDWRGTYYDDTIGQQVAKPNVTSFCNKKFSYPPSYDFVALVGDPTSYLKTNGIGEIAMPSTYTSLKSYDPYITSVTAAGPGIGYGLSRHDLRGLLRLTNGKGHISDTRVFHCEDDGGVRFLAIGPEGCYLLDQDTVQRWEAEESMTNTSRSPEDIAPFLDVDDVPRVNGDIIPEEGPDYQQAVQEFIRVFNEYASTTITGYNSFDGSHWLSDSEGDRVRASGLARLVSMETAPDEYYGKTRYELSDREYRGTTFEYEITPADFEYEIGEITDRVIGEDEYVIGYDTRWVEKEYIMSGSLNVVELQIRYVYFQDKDHDRYSHHDLEVGTKDSVIARFDPEDGLQEPPAESDTNS